MVEIGDKVLVFAAGSDYATAVPIDPVAVGDKVALYNLKDETRIAVPTLTFGIGDFAFVTPNFDFAGFDFKLDFNMQLIPLNLAPIGGDVTFIWSQIDSNAGYKNYGGCVELWLIGSGQYARKDVSPFEYRFCAFKFNGDFNDGKVGIYINDVFIESFCLYNKGIAWYRYDEITVGRTIHKLECRWTGVTCGGSAADVALIKMAFYNDPDYVLD